ncbi:terminase large subunit domain-containing protein [Nocardia huaxiensis]|uniref:terminase large subunit domain-containing protein n=1 Tax=Nocardia huaxiensis TaxID=2755382 RepID=UPI001FCFEABD|nr:terminase large subunit [Nocardia huaxiensis]
MVAPKGVGAKEPLNLRDFQKEIVRGAFAPGVRTALVSMPRANGKTALAAALGVAELFVGPASAEVLVVASDQRQANLTLNLARRMIELNPELADRVHVYKDHLHLPENDAKLIPLPADEAALHGWDPSLMIVDELHVVTEQVWEAVTSVAGKRPESLTLAISTPGHNPDSVMWKLVEYGRAGDDPSFYYKEHAAPEGCAIDDREAWKIGNPAMSCKRPFLTEDGMASVMRTMREPRFRQLRLGQWVKGSDAWLPWGSWDGRADTNRRPEAGERVVFGFDGSYSGDSTALIGCTLDGHVWVEGLWENTGDSGWRVSREDVTNAVVLAFSKYDVAELACDPYGWHAEIEQWQKLFGEKRVIEWPTNQVQRMAPATDRLYQAVVEETVTHDGDSRLAAHVAHCAVERTSMGDLVRKDRRNSPRKIDAAVAAIVAYDRAAWHAKKAKKKVRSFNG